MMTIFIKFTVLLIIPDRSQKTRVSFERNTYIGLSLKLTTIAFMVLILSEKSVKYHYVDAARLIQSFNKRIFFSSRFFFFKISI